MDYLKEILKGVLIGIANVVPGVSGGTLAVSMGIYDKLIGAVTHVARDTKESVKTLFPYGLGAMLGVVGLSFVIEFLFRRFPLQTSLTFIGLIAGGIPGLLKRLKQHSVGVTGTLVCTATFFLLLLLTFAGGAGIETVELMPGWGTFAALFFVGVVAAATMVIPGVSGTMILMMFGYYQPVLALINQFVLVFFEGNWGEVWKKVFFLVPFGFGILAGIFACAKLVEFLLVRSERLTYSAMIGLVLSSPFVILSGVDLNRVHIFAVLTGLVCFGLAFAGSARLSKSGKEQTES